MCISIYTCEQSLHATSCIVSCPVLIITRVCHVIATYAALCIDKIILIRLAGAEPGFLRGGGGWLIDIISNFSY